MCRQCSLVEPAASISDDDTDPALTPGRLTTMPPRGSAERPLDAFWPSGRGEVVQTPTLLLRPGNRRGAAHIAGAGRIPVPASAAHPHRVERHDDRHDDRHDMAETIDVLEAARRLGGVTPDAVRAKLRRGTLGGLSGQLRKLARRVERHDGHRHDARHDAGAGATRHRHDATRRRVARSGAAAESAGGADRGRPRCA